MFIKNKSARAGATKRPPVWRPQAFTTRVRQTRAAAAKLTQKAMLRGRMSMEAGIEMMAASKASRQLFQLGVYQKALAEVLT